MKRKNMPEAAKAFVEEAKIDPNYSVAMMGPPTMEMYGEIMKHNPLVTNPSTLLSQPNQYYKGSSTDELQMQQDMGLQILYSSVPPPASVPNTSPAIANSMSSTSSQQHHTQLTTDIKGKAEVKGKGKEVLYSESTKKSLPVEEASAQSKSAMMGSPTMEMYDELMKHNPLVTNPSTLVSQLVKGKSGSASISSQHPLADQQIKTGEEPNNAMMDSPASACEANESYEGFCTHDLEMIRLLTQIQDVRLQPASSSVPTVSPALVDACIAVLHQPSSASESAGLLKNEAPFTDRDMEMLRCLGLVSDDDGTICNG